MARMVVHSREPDRILLTVWTPTPGVIIGRSGSAAAAIREHLQHVVPEASVELRVVAGNGEASPARAGADDTVEPGSSVLDAAPGDPTPGRDLVPDLVGMAVGDAHDKARAAGFPLATSDPDGVPISFFVGHPGRDRWVVLAQSPRPGVLSPLHSPIVVSIEDRGGGGTSGDREPRVPVPPGGRARFEHELDEEDLEYVDELEIFDGVE